MFVPTAEQRPIVRALQSGRRHNIVYGTVGSGKTGVSIRCFMDRAMTGHADRGFTILAKRKALLRDPLLVELQQWARERAISPDVIKTDSEFMLPSLIGLPNRFNMKPFGVGGNQMKEDIQGGNKAGIFVDEGLNIDWVAVSEVFRRIRTPGFFSVWTMNTDAPPFHPLKKNFLDKIDRGEMNGTTTHVGMNRHPGVDEEYYTELAKTMTRLEIIRYIDGEFAGNTLSVYGDAWRDYPRGNIVDIDMDKMLDTTAGRRVQMFAGVDYAPAGTNAAVLVAWTSNGNYYVVDEWRHNHLEDGPMTDKEKARAMFDKFSKHGPIKNWWLDKANGHGVKMALAEFHDQNALLTDEQGNKDVLNVRIGCNRVRRMFELERLFIARHCEHTQEELGMYAYPESDPDGNPIKKNDHFMDALRYALISVPAQYVKASESELEDAGVSV